MLRSAHRSRRRDGPGDKLVARRQTRRHHRPPAPTWRRRNRSFGHYRRVRGGSTPTARGGATAAQSQPHGAAALQTGFTSIARLADARLTAWRTPTPTRWRHRRGGIIANDALVALTLSALAGHPHASPGRRALIRGRSPTRAHLCRRPSSFAACGEHGPGRGAALRVESLWHRRHARLQAGGLAARSRRRRDVRRTLLAPRQPRRRRSAARRGDAECSTTTELADGYARGDMPFGSHHFASEHDFGAEPPAARADSLRGRSASAPRQSWDGTRYRLLTRLRSSLSRGMVASRGYTAACRSAMLRATAPGDHDGATPRAAGAGPGSSTHGVQQTGPNNNGGLHIAEMKIERTLLALATVGFAWDPPQAQTRTQSRLRRSTMSMWSRRRGLLPRRSCAATVFRPVVAHEFAAGGPWGDLRLLSGAVPARSTERPGTNSFAPLCAHD